MFFRGLEATNQKMAIHDLDDLGYLHGLETSKNGRLQLCLQVEDPVRPNLWPFLEKMMFSAMKLGVAIFGLAPMLGVNMDIGWSRHRGYSIRQIYGNCHIPA